MKINTQNHKITKFTKRLACLFLLIYFGINVSYSTSYVEQKLSEKINETTLIVKGTLVNKYSKVENITMNITNGNKIIHKIPSSMYTTFVFTVDEVLKGTYSENTISVKMLGGCNEEACEEWSFGYDFNINEKGVLFLKYDRNKKIFKSTQGSSTVFNLKKSGELVSKSIHVEEDESANSYEHQTNFLVPTKNGDMKVLKKLNLSFLVSEIKKEKAK